MLPIRCYTCGKVIGNKWNNYKNLLENNTSAEALDLLGLSRYCCRRMILGNMDSDDDI